MEQVFGDSQAWLHSNGVSPQGLFEHAEEASLTSPRDSGRQPQPVAPSIFDWAPDEMLVVGEPPDHFSKIDAVGVWDLWGEI